MAQSEIRLLESDVIDQIAAGEVIERPANLVKELVENSLDAFAKNILVEVEQGGRNVRVTDDGVGILEEDLPKVFARHATSKISKTKDLFNLESFGFRGEAMASIASVAKAKLRSRRENSDTGYEISAEFGRIGEATKSGSAFGTMIEIRELFENVPARLKFMKSESSENSQIKNIIKAFALAHPDVSFKLRIDGELDLAYSENRSLLERAQNVLSSTDLYYCHESNSVGEVEIVFSDPKNIAKNSKQIWIFVQNRFVQDKSLQFAVNEAYRNLLMHGEYPIAVVKLSLPGSTVDINVHPAKTQVRFLDSSNVFRLVHGALRRAIEKAPWVSAKAEVANSSIETEKPSTPKIPVSAIVREYSNYELNVGAKVQYQQKSELSLGVISDLASQRTTFGSNQSDLQSTTQGDGFLQKSISENTKYWSSLQVLGQANLTYILTQAKDRLVLVDQHAAHERVAFEKLMRGYQAGAIESQAMLIPLQIELEPALVPELLEIREELLRSGIEIDAMGTRSIAIRSTPAFIKESALESALIKLAQQKHDFGGSFALEKKIGDFFASMACHSVIRAGQALSIPEMQALLSQMDEFPLSSFCPHGRPVSIEYSWSEIERAFGRIV